MSNIERPWRLTRKSIEKLAIGFNLSQRSVQNLESQKMVIPNGATGPKTLPVRLESFEPAGKSLLDFEAEENTVRLLYVFGSAFRLPIRLILPEDYGSTRDHTASVFRSLITSISIEVDNMTDAERDAEEARKLEKLAKKNVINIDVSDAGRAHQLLRQLTALGLAQGFESTVCYIPRSVAVRMSASGLRALGNVEVYETDTELGTQYRGKDLELAIILEVFGPKIDEHHIVGAVNKLADTLSICCQTSDGTLYRITLREDFSNA